MSFFKDISLIGKASGIIAGLQAHVADLKSQLKVAQDDVAWARDEASQKIQEFGPQLHKLSTLNAQIDSKLTTLGAQHKDNQEENELLLYQLYEVQEELENYFLRFQEAQSHQQNLQLKLDEANILIRKQRRELRYSTPTEQSNQWRYVDIQLYRYIEEPGYESLWIVLKEAKINHRYWQHFEFRLSAANVHHDRFSEQPHYEFPRLKGSDQAFENWFLESSDDVRGERFELRFHLGQGAMDMKCWDALSQIDKIHLVSLMQAMPQMLDDLAEGCETKLNHPWEAWKKINHKALEVLAGLVKL